MSGKTKRLDKKTAAQDALLQQQIDIMVRRHAHDEHKFRKDIRNLIKLRDAQIRSRCRDEILQAIPDITHENMMIIKEQLTD
jgi:hypothetical protein